MDDSSVGHKATPTRGTRLPLELVDRIIAATINFRRSRALRRTAHDMYMVEGAELTPGQVDILEALATRERWNIGDLSSSLGLDPATVSRGIPSLVKLRLAERDTSGSDRRHTIVSVTQVGRDALAEIIERRRYLAREALVGVPRERVALMVEVMEEWLRLNEAVLPSENPTINRW